MKYHIHIYKVVGKTELDVFAENEIEAKQKALEVDKYNTLYNKSDCAKIVLAFKD